MIGAARAFAWPFVLIGEAVHNALRSSLPQALVPLSAIGLSLAAAILLYLMDRRIRRLSGIAP